MKIKNLTQPSLKISTQIQDAFSIQDIIKIQENIGRTWQKMNLRGIFSDLNSEAITTKSKINKWVYINLKRFGLANETKS